MKKIMILGAGAGQIPFINICKNKGFKVIVVGPKGAYPGFLLSNKKYFLDTRDKEEILKIAYRENINAILSDQTDVSVPSVAYVSEKMGLKTIGYETSKYFTNKYLMRKKARELGIAVPEFSCAYTLQEAKKELLNIGFPAIIKPIDSSGSRGVVKINSIKELEQYFDFSLSFSNEKSIIIEQFIQGIEYIADGLAIDNKYINTDLGIKEYFSKEGFYISKMCMLSSSLSITEPAELSVLVTNKTLIEGFGLKFGITHGEYIISNKDNKVYLVEIAARGGGVFLSSDLTPCACGIKTNEILIDYLSENKSIDVNNLTLKKGVAAWVCFELKAGVIKAIINKEKLKCIPGVFKIIIDDIKVGVSLGEMMDDTGKKGPILVKADTREDCYRVIEMVKNTFDVIVDSNGLDTHIIW